MATTRCGPHKTMSTPLVERLALAKATVVAGQFLNALIIGCDQVADFEGDIIGKPGDHDSAVALLKRFSGKAVTTLTGMCLLDTKTCAHQMIVEPYTVVFRQLTESIIGRHLKKDPSYHCAGGINAESLGVALFTRMEVMTPLP